MTAFAVGDHVRPLPSRLYAGEALTVSAVKPGNPTLYELTNNDGPIGYDYWDDELEGIDASDQMDAAQPDDPVPAGLAGSPADDAGGAGSEAEPAKASPSPALLYSLLVAQAQAIAQLRDESSFFTNRIQELDHQIATASAVTTTRRMRVNVTKNTKGYSYDTTFEITSDDPAIDLQEEMEAGLGLADRAARQEIDNRQYTDEEGLPGSDDKPF